MKKLLLVMAFCFTAGPVLAQCNGVFPSNTVCGNLTGSPALPTAFPPSGGGGMGNVMGPVSSTVNNIAAWDNTVGTLLKDSGIPYTSVTTGPGSATVNHVVTWNNVGGTLLKDSGIPSASLVTGPGSATVGHIATWNNVGGTLLADGGILDGFSVGCVNIETFGGAGNNSTDNLTPWNNAVASFGSNDVCIQFGVGTYRFSAVASATPGTSANIKVRGVGKNISHLLWFNNTAGMTLNTGNEMAVEVDGLDFTTSVANSNAALTINSSDCTGSKYSSHFHDLAFRGSGSYPSRFYWGTELVLNTLSFVNVDEVDFFGDTGNHPNGMVYQSANAPTCYALILNVSKVNFINTNVAFFYGTYAQGITITQSNFTNGVFGISLPNTSVNPSQLVVSDSQFNVTNDQILIQAVILGAQFHGNTFAVPTSHTGIHITAGAWFTINGNIFLAGGAQGLTGIQVDSNTTENAGSVTGNSFTNLHFGTALAAGADHWNVNSNMYSANVSTAVSNMGTNNIIGTASP